MLLAEYQAVWLRRCALCTKFWCAGAPDSAACISFPCQYPCWPPSLMCLMVHLLSDARPSAAVAWSMVNSSTACVLAAQGWQWLLRHARRPLLRFRLTSAAPPALPHQPVRPTPPGARSPGLQPLQPCAQTPQPPPWPALSAAQTPPGSQRTLPPAPAAHSWPPAPRCRAGGNSSCSAS